MAQVTSQRVAVVTDVPIPKLFDFLRVPANHVRLDGSGQLVSAEQTRIDAIGDVFRVRVRQLPRGEFEVENHVVEFIPDARLTWMPAELGEAPHGVLWDWLFDVGPKGETIVTHSCDWSLVEDSAGAAAGTVAAGREGDLVSVGIDEMRLSIRRLIELVSSTVRLA